MFSDLPEAFCWSKFSSEAGETPEQILSRKDLERARNGGVFLWGIGSSIAPSLRLLLGITRSPAIIFTPMISRPAFEDVHPPAIAHWQSATGMDGSAYEIPRHSAVTSRVNSDGSARKHFALVCFSDTSLTEPGRGSLDDSKLRNLRSGARLGASQVTSVVRRVSSSSHGRYSIAIRALLTYPYLISLSDFTLSERLPSIGHALEDELGQWNWDLRKDA